MIKFKKFDQFIYQQLGLGGGRIVWFKLDPNLKIAISVHALVPRLSILGKSS